MARKRNKLTAPEWAVVAGLAVLLVTSLGVGFWFYRMEKTNRMVKGDLLRIETACIRYRGHYNKWPRLSTVGYDIHYGMEEDYPNRELFNPLRGVAGPGNRAHEVNPDQKECIWIPLAGPGRSGLNPLGDFVDPWGSAYQVVLDLDYNNVCDLPGTIYDRVIGKGIVVWSHGPDRRPNSPDDILSWKIQLREDILGTGPDTVVEDAP